MKYALIFFTLVFLGGFAASAQDLPGQGTAERAILQKLDARQALELANQWKWSKKEIRSYVTSQEVGFTFPDGKTTKIALPKDRMVVAVAPYVNRTHK